MKKLTLISHILCPYVQRSVISLVEKQVAFERIDIDLANKPQWFLDISPLGKTPVLKVGDRAIFESAVILEYLEDTQRRPLHPSDALSRAEHRSWIEFSSSILNDIAGFYSVINAFEFTAKIKALSDKFDQLESRLAGGPYFSGKTFCLVDVVFGPVFRYFDVFDKIGQFEILDNKPKLAAWRQALSNRPSVKQAVSHDYPERLRHYLKNKPSYLSSLMVEEKNS
jgi:glutathione S-transferase